MLLQSFFWLCWFFLSFVFPFLFFCWQSLIWALCSQGLWIVCTLCEPQFYTRYAYFLKCSSLGWTLQKGFLWLFATVFCDFLCCWAHKAFSLVSEYPKLLFWPLLRIYLSLWWISFDFAAHVYIYLYNYLIWQLFWRHIVGSQKRLQNGNAMLGINFRPFTFLEVAHVYPWNSFGMNCPTKTWGPESTVVLHNSGSLYWPTSKYFYTTCCIHPFTHRLVDAFFHV